MDGRLGPCRAAMSRRTASRPRSGPLPSPWPPGSGLACFCQQAKKPCQAGIHHSHFRNDGINLESRQRQGSIQTQDTKTRRVHADESSRQGGNEIRLCNDGKCEHEIGDSQRDPARPASLHQKLIDETMRVATLRDHQMLHLTISLQGWIICEWMPGTHGNHEILLIETPLFETRRDVIGGNESNIHATGLEISKGGAPDASRRGQNLAHADIHGRRALFQLGEQRRQHDACNPVRRPDREPTP